MTTIGVARFPEKHACRVAACAALSGRIAQLATSHPLLLFALATGYGPLEARQETIRRAELGRPLRDVCGLLQIPYALRHVPPEILTEPIMPARLSERSAQIVAARIARQEEAWGKEQTLRAAFYGTRICGEDFGMWLSDPQRVSWLPRRLSAVRALALFAWCSGQQNLLPESVWRRRWSAHMTWRSAVAQTRVWIDHLKFYLYFDATPIANPWAEAASVDGFEIVPLCRFGDLIGEVRDMENCLYTYANRLAADSCRLFGVRRQGSKAGTVEVRLSGEGKLHVAQFRGPGNAQMGLDAWRAVLKWVERQPSVGDPGDGHEAERHERFASLAARYAAAVDLPRELRAASFNLHRLQADLLYLESLFDQGAARTQDLPLRRTLQTLIRGEPEPAAL